MLKPDDPFQRRQREREKKRKKAEKRRRRISSSAPPAVTEAPFPPEGDGLGGLSRAVDRLFSPLGSDRLEIRSLLPSDAEAMFAYRSYPEVSRYQNWEPASVEEVGSFIKALQGTEPPEWFQVGIALRGTGELIGDCGFRILPGDPRQAEIGISVAPAFQHRGYALEALRILLGHLFSTLGLHRVHGSVDPRNAASLALLRRAGMRQEAHFLESYWSKGEWTDDVVFGILEREWEEIHFSS